MSTQELIELALLDAMALLDDDERASFDAAFRAAAPAVQAQVRREQTRLANIEKLLPEVTAPAGLRAAVIEAVRRAMSAPAQGGIIPALMPSRRVTPLWRAASVGLATAAVILIVVVLQLKADFADLERRITADSQLGEIAGRFGSQYVRDVLFDADTRRVVFTSQAPEFKGQASVFVNADWKSAKFFCSALATPAGRTYKLAVLDDQGTVVDVLAEFTSSGGLISRDVNLAMAKANLAIVSDGGNVIGSAPKQVLSSGKLDGTF